MLFHTGGSFVWFAVLSVFVCLLQLSHSYLYDLAYVDYNLNQNPLATTPLEYWGEVSQRMDECTSIPSTIKWSLFPAGYAFSAIIAC